MIEARSRVLFRTYLTPRGGLELRRRVGGDGESKDVQQDLGWEWEENGIGFIASRGVVRSRMSGHSAAPPRAKPQFELGPAEAGSRQRSLSERDTLQWFW